MGIFKSKYFEILLIICYSISGLYFFRFLIPNILQCSANSCHWSNPRIVLYFFGKHIFHFGPEEILFTAITSLSVFIFHKSKFRLIEFAGTIYIGLFVFIITNGFTDYYLHIPDELFQIILPIILPIILYYNHYYKSYYVKSLFDKILKFLRL